MMNFSRSDRSLIAISSMLLVVGCNTPGPATDAGQDVAIVGDGGLPTDFFPPRTAPFTETTNSARSVKVTVSGEALAQEGYTYNANPMGEPVFVDGWTVRFQKYYVVVGNVRLNAQGTDPSMRDVVGASVALNPQSYLVDLQKMGPVAGAGGGTETAHPLVLLERPDTGGMFDTATRYAFSYDTVPASTLMKNVNVPESARADVDLMIARGWTHYFVGTATYAGRTSSATVDPTFQMYPRTVNFAFGFRAAANYINCHNPEIGSEDLPANRGVQPSANQAVRAQLTMHTDHFFWRVANTEGESLHFDPFAARAQGFGMADPRTVTLDDLMGVNPLMLVDRMNNPVRDRGTQTMGYTAMGNNLIYEVNGAAGVTDLRDMVVFNARAQGHFNSDGLCFVKPNGALAY